MAMDTAEMTVHMTFFWGRDVEVLFAGWPAKNLPMFFLCLLFVFLLSLTVELLSAISPSINFVTSPAASAAMETGMHAIRVGLGYLLMLAVMSFNAWIFLLAIAGHATGKFILFKRGFTHQSPSSSENRPIPVLQTKL